ncbi:MAG: AmmeMemoRadiSam system protein A [bacterium]
MLKEREKSELLRFARFAVEEQLRQGRAEFREASEAGLHRPGGAFVTLHRGEELRGCIGRIISPDPLYRTVQEMAIAAATQDYRFSPVRFEELVEIEFEISALTEPKPIAGVEEIQVGLHGLIVSAGARRGLLLPQVATEYGWDAATFLSHTCQKAGLPLDYWRHGPLRIEAFSAEVFSEGPR